MVVPKLCPHSKLDMKYHFFHSFPAIFLIYLESLKNIGSPKILPSPLIPSKRNEIVTIMSQMNAFESDDFQGSALEFPESFSMGNDPNWKLSENNRGKIMRTSSPCLQNEFVNFLSSFQTDVLYLTCILQQFFDSK